MVNHIILYAVNVSVHSYDSDGGVGRAVIARYLQCTPKTARSRMDELIKDKLISEVRVPANRGHGFKYLYNVTRSGLNYLDANFDKVKSDFMAWQNQQLLDELSKVRKQDIKARKQSKKSKVSDKQKVMF